MYNTCIYTHAVPCTSCYNIYIIIYTVWDFMSVVNKGQSCVACAYLCVCSLRVHTSQWCVEEVGAHTARVKGHPGGHQPKKKVMYGRERVGNGIAKTRSNQTTSSLLQASGGGSFQ